MSDKEVSDTTQLFATDLYVGKNTVYGWIKEALISAPNNTLTKQELHQLMNSNYKPKTASKFGPSYVTSYVRSAIAKGIITTDASQCVASYPEAPKSGEKPEGQPKTPKAKKEPKAKEPKTTKLTEGEQGVISVLMADTESGDMANGIFRQDVSEVAKSLSAPEKVVAKNVASLVKRGLVVASTGEGDTVFVRLSQEGYDYASQPKVEEAA